MEGNKLLLEGCSLVLTRDGYRKLEDLENSKVAIKTAFDYFEDVEVKSLIVEEEKFFRVKTKLGKEVLVTNEQFFLKNQYDKLKGKYIPFPDSLRELRYDSSFRFPKIEPVCLYSDLVCDEISYSDGFNAKRNFKAGNISCFFKQLYCVRDRISWLEGLFAQSGNLVSRSEGGRVYYTILLTGSEEFLKELIKLLSTLGISARFRSNKQGIIISHYYILKLKELGFRWKGENLDLVSGVDNRTEYDSVVEVTKELVKSKKMYFVEVLDGVSKYVLVNDLPLKVSKK